MLEAVKAVTNFIVALIIYPTFETTFMYIQITEIIKIVLRTKKSDL